jgi:predicted GIY-YIG superfamily endonuclease
MLINNFIKTYVVYSITCNQSQNVYVGSTSNLINRIANHITTCKKNNSKCTSRHVLEKNDFKVDVIRANLTKEEAKKSEFHFIEAFGDKCINKNKPMLIDKEEYQKIYQLNYRNNKRALTQNPEVVV